uniref:small monomeric GTPase n=1 Tax=Ascaris suum TaxID=6253 RepID=F1KUQ4_ASCSU
MDACTSRGCCAGDSDYCTWSATSSEDDPELRRLASDSDSAGSSENVRIRDGHCPHCFDIFENAVMLECGHSLCSECNYALVDALNRESRPLRRRGIRMGITVSHSAVKAYSDWAGSQSSVYSTSERLPLYLSPRCPVCGAAPKMTPPKRYHRSGVDRRQHMIAQTIVDNPLYTSSHCYENVAFEDGTTNNTAQNISAMYQFLSSHHSFADKTAEEIINDAKIITCNIAIIGAKKTGKSNVAKRQFLNEVFFGENEDELCAFGDLGGTMRSGSELVNDRRSEGIKSRFMIEIIDGDDVQRSVKRADAFMLIYSVIDRRSFYEAIELLRLIAKTRSDEVPTVIVGTKADIDKKWWQVASHEGQTLARRIGCPFIEVSSKTNDRIHEAFVELMRLVDSLHNFARRYGLKHLPNCAVKS